VISGRGVKMCVWGRSPYVELALASVRGGGGIPQNGEAQGCCDGRLARAEVIIQLAGDLAGVAKELLGELDVAAGPGTPR